MVTCPKCRGQMSVTQSACPHCRYDFPDQNRFNLTQIAERGGIAYSGLADFALGVGMTLSGFGAIASAISTVLLTFNGDYIKGLIQAPLSFLLSFALFVVFKRASDIEH